MKGDQLDLFSDAPARQAPGVGNIVIFPLDRRRKRITAAARTLVSRKTEAGTRPRPGHRPVVEYVSRIRIHNKSGPLFDLAKYLGMFKDGPRDVGNVLTRGLDKTYRGLLEAQQEEDDPDSLSPTRPLDTEISRSLFNESLAGRNLVVEWDRFGGFASQLQQAQKAARGIVEPMGARKSQRAFLQGFNEAVPATARVAVYRELASGRPTFVRPASDEDVAEFTSHPSGKALAEEWGSNTPTLVAMAWARIDRVVDSLSEEDGDAVLAWLGSLSAGQVGMLLKGLVRF